LKSNILVEQFLIHPTWIRYVRTIPTSTIEHYLSPPTWQGWINSFNKAWNWSLSLITFSINLLSIFKRTMGLNIFGVLYNSLLDLGIIIDVDVLKCNGQCSNSIYVLAMLMILSRYSISLMISLICLQDSLSSLGVESFLNLSIAKRNSSLEKEDYLV